MIENVEAAADLDDTEQMQTPERLIRHYLALAAADPDRPSARERLEEKLGPELTRQLLESLVSRREQR